MEEKIIHNYKLTTNERGYIVGGYAVLDDDYDWVGQMADYKEPSLTYGCYKLVNGNIVKDETEYQRLKDIETKQNRISELKQKLTDTDYIYNSIREGGRSEEYYADVIANRKAWRKEIQDLEEELGL